jgi:hypothetical protein
MGKQEEFTNLAAKHAADEKFDRSERNSLGDFAKRNKLSELEINLAYARVAVNFARQKIKFAANHDMYEEGSYDHEFLTNGKLDPKKFKDEDRCVNLTLRTQDEWQDNAYFKRCNSRLKCIQSIQALARKTECGNCLEQAAVAFMLLYRLGVRPIDYVSLYPRHLDHSFVVVGRVNGSVIGKDAWLNWGPGAVVCDPWAVGLLRGKAKDNSSGKAFGDSFGVYPATQLREKMTQMFPGFHQLDYEHGEDKR